MQKKKPLVDQLQVSQFKGPFERKRGRQRWKFVYGYVCGKSMKEGRGRGRKGEGRGQRGRERALIIVWLHQWFADIGLTWGRICQWLADIGLT